MPTATRLRDAFGGPRVIPGAGDLDAFADRVREGLPVAALDAVARRFEIPMGELTAVLHLPARTLARRKREGRLHADESDRLFRVGRVAALADEILGETAKAARWLRQPNRALGGRTPLEALDTDLGATQVETVLRRVEHGLFS
jgi:putative toxin-antitoxin system antitoxin component (TIGR02293 family)